MRPEIVQLLDELNRRFYHERGAEFSATRDRPWSGWDRVLDHLDLDRSTPLRVLDVGCGNGRFGTYLREHLPRTRRLIYDGIDASPELLQIARERLSKRGIEGTFRVANAIQDAERAFPPGPFDLIVYFGFLHHVPSFEMRRKLLDIGVSRLARDGLLAATWWRFGQYDRFEKRILDWESEDAQRFAPGVVPKDLEAGDHLLAWGDLGPVKAARYCHFSSEEERRLTDEALLGELVETFDADGPDQRFNHYWLVRQGAIGGSERRGAHGELVELEPEADD